MPATSNWTIRGEPGGLELSGICEGLRTLADGVLVAGKDQRLVFANDAFEGITGYRAADVAGRTCAFLQGADTDEATVSAIRSALDAGVPFCGEILNYAKTGVPFWNDLSISPLRGADGDITGYIAIIRDVTARKLAEQALLRTATRQRQMIELSQAGIVLHDRDAQVVYANDMAERLLGVETRQMQANGGHAPTWRFLFEDGSPMPVEDYPVARILRSGTPLSGLVAGIEQPGREVTWVVCSAYPMPAADGSWDGVLVSFTDITQLKRTASALQTSEQRLRLVLRGANDAGWDWDIANNELYLSPRWWSMLGLTEEPPGDLQRWSRIIHPDDSSRVAEEIKKAIRGGAAGFELELRLQHASGRYLTVLSRAFILRDPLGRAIRISGTNTDITERKRAEEALRQSEAILHAFVEASPIPAILTDDAGTFLYVNPACVTTFGYSLTDVPSLRAWRAQAYPDPRYRRWVGSTWAKRLERARHAGRPIEALEVIVRCKDGSERTVLVTTFHLPGASAVSRSFVLIDVTEQRRLERGIIEAANREQSRLGMDLHDGLGQELTGLSLSLAGLAGRLRSAEAGAIEAELRDLAALAAQCIATTRAIAHGLSPVEPGCAGLQRALLRLGERGHIGDMQVEIKLSGLNKGALHQAVGDSIYRIVQEALANAAKHSGAKHAVIEVHRKGSTLNVSVRDDGCGMPPHLHAEGSGMSIMRYRARAVGGQLEIETKPNVGTIVKCRFPLP